MTKREKYHYAITMEYMDKRFRGWEQEYIDNFVMAVKEVDPNIVVPQMTITQYGFTPHLDIQSDIVFHWTIDYDRYDARFYIFAETNVPIPVYDILGSRELESLSCGIGIDIRALTVITKENVIFRVIPKDSTYRAKIAKIQAQVMLGYAPRRYTTFEPQGIPDEMAYLFGNSDSFYHDYDTCPDCGEICCAYE